MNIVIFTHPAFFGSTSMPKYVKMLVEGMKSRGHHTEVATAKAFFSKLSFSQRSFKYLGYMDQFLVFPLQMKNRLRRFPDDTLFIFSDHALGPWIPLVKKRPHVVHCHDFLAQRSAMGEIPQNAVGIMGRIYQAYIRKGFRSAENFISISHNTKSDLHLFLKKEPDLSEVVYNGFNQDFQLGKAELSREQLSTRWDLELASGYILHVGGNQFYKNRMAVIQIYSKWREITASEIPLIMVGNIPSIPLIRERERSMFSRDIHFLFDVNDSYLKKFYTGASLLLFPSLEEGFGWPIAEAMASGCPVVTINKAPMNEVGGSHCFYLAPFPQDNKELEPWIEQAASLVERVIQMPEHERKNIITQAKGHSRKFDADKAIESIEAIYSEVLKSYKS